jgi:hypothetical protein
MSGGLYKRLKRGQHRVYYMSHQHRGQPRRFNQRHSGKLPGGMWERGKKGNKENEASGK